MKQKEDKLFSEKGLQYDHTAVAKQGFFDKLMEWLAEKLFGKAGPGNVYRAREIIIWTIIIIAVILVIWIMRRSELVSLIRPKVKNTSFNFSDISEDLSVIDFNSKIEEALSNNDERSAIRWQYLRVLFLLDKKQIILFTPYKTNIDYSFEIKDQQLKHIFGNLSRIYEYVWYGKFALRSGEYNSLTKEFNDLMDKLNVQG